jgi:hypothetical protein
MKRLNLKVFGLRVYILFIFLVTLVHTHKELSGDKVSGEKLSTRCKAELDICHEWPLWLLMVIAEHLKDEQIACNTLLLI